jgi:predicted transcriptional regulator
MYNTELLAGLIESNEQFVKKFREILFDKKITIKEFCENTKIPESTVYKIISNPKKDFRISTLRLIFKAIDQIEGKKLEVTTIGIITTRGALDNISSLIKMDNKEINIKEYPATTIEEEIIQGVKAEREGVKGIICGPIAATTIEKVVNIPVISLQFKESSLNDAIKNISKKI